MLCVFSYLAAGQDQKKHILQQAARGPDQQELETEDNKKNPEPMTTLASSSISQNTRSSTSPVPKRKSDVNNTPVTNTKTIASYTPPSTVESNKNLQYAGTKVESPPSNMSVGGAPPPRHPPPPLIPPRQNSQSSIVNRQIDNTSRQYAAQQTPTRQMSQGPPPAIPPRRGSSSMSMGRHNTMPDSQEMRYYM